MESMVGSSILQDKKSRVEYMGWRNLSLPYIETYFGGKRIRWDGERVSYQILPFMGRWTHGPSCRPGNCIKKHLTDLKELFGFEY